MAWMWLFFSLLCIQPGAFINDVNHRQNDLHGQDSLVVKSDEVIAFSAELSMDTSLLANVPIMFDNVITNAGGLYLNDTGEFICTDDDLYIFIWSLLKPIRSDLLNMRCIALLRIGGSDTKYGPKTTYYSSMTYSGIAEMTTVLPCTTSPPANVSILSAPWTEDQNRLVVYRGYGWTSFSGFRLQAPIAFTVELLQDQYLTAGGRIRFDRVLYNFGDHYDTINHAFKCPDSGIYAFSISTHTKDTATPWSVSRLMMQGKLAVQGPITHIAKSSAWDSGSASSNAVLQCTQGFSVYVEAQAAHDFILNSYGSELTAFTGYKLYDVVEGAVAFMAVMTNNFTVLYENQPVIYDEVITNVGDAFDANVSRFTCPDNDYYLFTLTATANAGGISNHLILNMDDTLVKRLFLSPHGSDSATSGSSSVSVIKQCNTGSYFQVQALTVDGTTVFLGRYASFIGYKIPTPGIK